VFYVHADHLGTPRVITRPSDNKVVWKWDSTEAFGNNAPNENPSALGNFKYNLRMPGQYFDQETGTFYNYFRDYDPALGRYIESDPIGLGGGVNTYSYVRASPLMYIDPYGLQSTLACANPVNAPACAAAGMISPIVVPNDKDLQPAIEKEANRREYKRICDEPQPPNLDPCELAKWRLNKAQSCKAARDENTKRWWGGEDKRHSTQLAKDLENAIKDAEKAVKRECKCPC
jgi:RHS repeat-associated protein